jgi:hypothetical protein
MALFGAPIAHEDDAQRAARREENALAWSGNAAREPRGIIRTADAREGLRAFSREATVGRLTS